MAALALGALAGCGEEAPPGGGAAPQTFAGKVEGTKAYIALVSNGRELASGYVCDGRRVSTWIERAPIAGGRAELKNRRGARLGQATLAGERASGEVTVDGKRHSFTAAPASGPAGLYRALKDRPGKGSFVEAGWIVLADGTQRGASNLNNQGNVNVQPAGQLNTSTGSGAAGRAGDLAAQRVRGFIDPIGGF